jgi:hypothetical protein
LGHFFRDLTFGPLLGHFWATFGPIYYFLGHFREIFWATLGHFTSGPLLGHLWATCGPLLGHYTIFWATSALFLGHFYATYLFYGPLLGYFWATLGPLVGHLPIFGPLWPFFWATFGPLVSELVARCKDRLRFRLGKNDQCLELD